MKILILSACLLLLTFTVNGQFKQLNIVKPDTSGKQQEKQNNKGVQSTSTKPLIFGYQFKLKTPITDDSFIQKPYRDSLGMKAVNIPNAYVKEADKSVAMPGSYFQTIPKEIIKPVGNVEQMVKPSRKPR